MLFLYNETDKHYIISDFPYSSGVKPYTTTFNSPFSTFNLTILVLESILFFNKMPISATATFIW